MSIHSQVLEALKANGVFRAAEFAEDRGLNLSSVHGAISHLRKQGLRIENQDGRYFLAPGPQVLNEEPEPKRRRSTKLLAMEGAVPPLGIRLQVVALAMDGKSRVAVTLADSSGGTWTMSLVPKPDWVEDE